MKTLMTILLLPLFVAVQSMAAVCSSECDLDKLPLLQTEKKSTEHQGCHQKSSEKESQSEDKKDCANKVCQLDDVVKSDVFEIELTQAVFIDAFSVKETLFFLSSSLDHSVLFSNGPPGFGQYFNVPRYIQKSSFII